MRHGKKGRKFGRMRGARRAFLGNLANDLIRAGSIETTEARAKEIRPVVERLVTIAKKKTLAARRIIQARVKNEGVVEKLISNLAERYESRPGGYLRITKLARTRKRDGSPVAKIEFV